MIATDPNYRPTKTVRKPGAKDVKRLWVLYAEDLDRYANELAVQNQQLRYHRQSDAAQQELTERRRNRISELETRCRELEKDQALISDSMNGEKFELADVVQLLRDNDELRGENADLLMADARRSGEVERFRSLKERMVEFFDLESGDVEDVW